jgi:hypothetical protein
MAKHVQRQDGQPDENAGVALAAVALLLLQPGFAQLPTGTIGMLTAGLLCFPTG